VSEIHSLNASMDYRFRASRAGMAVTAVKMAAAAERAMADVLAENAKMTAEAEQKAAAAARGGISIYV